MASLQMEIPANLEEKGWWIEQGQGMFHLDSPLDTETVTDDKPIVDVLITHHPAIAVVYANIIHNQDSKEKYTKNLARVPVWWYADFKTGKIEMVNRPPAITKRIFVFFYRYDFFTKKLLYPIKNAPIFKCEINNLDGLLKTVWDTKPFIMLGASSFSDYIKKVREVGQLMKIKYEKKFKITDGQGGQKIITRPDIPTVYWTTGFVLEQFAN
jgi:hypothetical protein